VGWEAFWQGQRLHLSPTEFDVLAHLAQRAGQVVTYEALLQDVWGSPLEQGGSLSQVRSTIARLRQKLAAVADHSCQIVSVRGMGYRLDLPATRHRAYPSRRPVVLLIGLILATAVLLAALIAGWLYVRQAPGRPTALVRYRGQQVPIGLLWALERGQHCGRGPDGVIYCFDTPEERAAAMDALLRGTAPQGP
jgi:hypothetical protein